MNNPAARLNLLVLRSQDIERAVTFYRLLGLHMTRHAHDTGPQHYAAELDGCVLEIYPASAKSPTTAGLRIGFHVTSVDELIPDLAAIGSHIVSMPQNSEWGRRAVVKDFDGHTVELLSKSMLLP